MKTMSTTLGFLLAVCAFCALPLAGCGGGGGGESCEVDTCSGHGTCDDSGGDIVCTCNQGYGGDRCDTCASGYQDNDGDGKCLPNCATAGLQCSEHAACDDTSGVAHCVCETGYEGATCSSCADGYQDFDDNGTCEPDCDTAGLDCSGHGICDDASGTPVCVCSDGYVGDDCSGCDDGYQDNDGDASCLPDCEAVAPDCGEHGQCDDSGGEAVCACDTGYAGRWCEMCADGYQDNDVDQICEPDCTTSDIDCHGHGDCDDSLGHARCVCHEGYIGELCDACDYGYQDNDGDGSCLPSCAIADIGDCSMHGECDDASGVAQCGCYEGYTGDACDQCAGGYQDNDQNGTCHPDCDTADLGCVHGSCEDGSGQAECVCDQGYGGDLCDQCTGGYQDNDGDDVCQPNCAKAIADGLIDCPDHAHCEDGTGTAQCVCDDGYQGAACDQCISGYQDNDANGTCQPDCDTATTGDGTSYTVSCTEGGHGACDDSGGQAVCVCTDPYQHDGHGHCVEPTGYTCATAIMLDIAAGTVGGTTLDAGDDYQGSCQYQGAEEVVYWFNVNEPVHARFTVTGYDTMMYIRTDCEDPDSEIACQDEGAPNHGTMIEVDLEVGTYYLFVDGWYGACGAYELSIDITCPVGQIFDPSTGVCVDDPCLDPNPCTEPNKTVCVPELPASYTCYCDPGYIDDPDNPGTCIVDPNPHGESCADAMPLTVEDGSVDGSTLDAVNDDSGSCGGSGPDRVYYFTLDEAMRAAFEASGYDTVLHLRSTCDDVGTEIDCDDEGGSAPNGSLIVEFLDPGTYYIWLDSWSGGGDYLLEYSFRTDPCAGDPCPGTPECIAAQDWSSYECVCPEGTLPWGSDCVDDPCDPNPCTAVEHRNRCVVDLPDGHFCECNIGYIDDPDNEGQCIMDPDANEWAILVYLNADSNLDPAGVDDIAEMGVGGSNPYVHIVAQWDSASSNSGDALRVYVTQGGYDVIENMGEVDMGNWETLRDFGIWGVENYPARHYALIMWDHGSGWDKAPDSEMPTPWKGFSYDDSGGHISVANGEYAQALAGITAALGDKLDLIGHDECLMGMWEVAEASAPYGHYFVASEETEPFDGWAYDGWVPTLVNDHEMTPEELAIEIVDTYHAAQSDNATLSAIHLDTMAALNGTISAFADALMAHSDLYASIDSVVSSSQCFGGWGCDDFRDLKDFAMGISAMSGAPADLVTAADNLVSQLEVSITHSMAQSSHPGAYGMAIYLPTQSGYVDSAYYGASWSVNTTWDEFLQDFAD